MPGRWVKGGTYVLRPGRLPYVPLDAEFWKRSDPTDARDALVETLRYDLLGPLEAEEELDESPLTRYLVGMLSPFGTMIPPEEDDSLDSGGGS